MGGGSFISFAFDAEFFQTAFIGLWHYRLYKQPKRYAVTFVFDGYYWDSPAYDTPAGAIQKAHEIWRKLVDLQEKGLPLPSHQEVCRDE